MALGKSDIEKIAHLARLSIDEKDMPAYVRELGNILELVDQMSSADTEGLVPMAHPLDVAQRFREDCVTESDEHERFQSIAPQVEADLYLVPKVIE